MGVEDPKKIFHSILNTRKKEVEEEIAKDSRIKAENERTVARLAAKYDSEINPALIKEEKKILAQEPISSILSILDSAADTIVSMDGKGRKIKLPREIHFIVDFLGSHPIHEHPVVPRVNDELKATFVRKIEARKSITGVVDSFFAVYGWSYSGTPRLSAHITGIKKQIADGKLEWEIGTATGKIKLDSFDRHAFADLVATKVAKGNYYTAPDPSWSFN